MSRGTVMSMKMQVLSFLPISCSYGPVSVDGHVP